MFVLNWPKTNNIWFKSTLEESEPKLGLLSLMNLSKEDKYAQLRIPDNLG